MRFGRSVQGSVPGSTTLTSGDRSLGKLIQMRPDIKKWFNSSQSKVALMIDSCDRLGKLRSENVGEHNKSSCRQIASTNACG